MASRSVARIMVTLGMVQVGMKLYISASSNSVSFNMMSKNNRYRVGQRLFEKLPESTDDNVVWGEEVSRSDTLKGFEYARDSYVVFSDEEIENMQAAKKDTLDITEFVPLSEIDFLHVEKTYYTGPDKGMDKSFSILYEMLKSNNRAAIGTWVARGKEHLVAIRAYRHGIIMHQMYYDTEVRAFEDNCAKIQISPVELAMGKVLMDTLFNPTFDKSKYRDTFIDKVMKAIEIKTSGGTISEVKTAVNNVGMETALINSLKAMGMSDAEINAMLVQVKKDARLAESASEPTPIAIAEEPKKKERKPRARKAS